MANIITSIRILSAIVLIFCPMFSILFFIFYIICGISDVLDGIVARHLKKETKFGARYDTIADIVFTVIVIIKVLLTVYIPTWLIIWTFIIAIIKCINIISGFIIYKHFVTEHTIINKICGIFLFFLPLCIIIFSWEIVEILFILAGIIATIAAMLECYYIFTRREIE